LSLGKGIRLRTLFDEGRGLSVLTPLDDSLLVGPEQGLRNIGLLLREVAAGGATAVMGFRGLYERHPDPSIKLSRVLNLSASTVRGLHTRKVLVGTVEDAVRMGMNCVGVHVNVGSAYEAEMLSHLASVVRDAERFGMPTLALMYARGEKGAADDNFDSERLGDGESYATRIRHAVRVGVELGADVIKTQYTGSAESFRSVVDVSCGVPILIAGGKKKDIRSILEDASNAISVGGKGVAFGRNVFCRRNARQFVALLRDVVFGIRTVEEALVGYDANQE
jgi:fructose-bisphosphate aldolase/2-amino-3,7-dideoxy-D-threo-hept-6-ulosonate synthase